MCISEFCDSANSPTLKNSYYEATLFAACFSVAFFVFLRVGEFALSQNSEIHMLRIEDISLEFGGESYFEYPLFKNRSVG
jgi:hypothetical protein